MELMNALAKLDNSSAAARNIMQEALEKTVLLLSPIVPHICHTLWRELRPGTELFDQPWPHADPAALIRDEIELVVQVNGKLRGRICVGSDAKPGEVERLALESDQVEKFVTGKKIKKVIVVPGRLINIVV
jgi:leucyl-tRNA synthetase